MKLSPIKALNCQSVNRQLLCQVLEEEMSTPAPLKQVSMSSEEENAVRYASGFVPMRFMKKYKKINNTRAAQFVDCLSHMALSSSDEESSYYEYTKTWIDMVNRGGLFCVNERTFLFFFQSMELKTQSVLPQHLNNLSVSKKELYSQIVDDEDVKFQWSMMSLDIQDEDHSMELLKTIVEEWVKLRGFAVTSLRLEDYKHSTQETIKAKKGLRKELQKK